jgi:prepilin-type N-terminal cleavage/methylation domain-containing protein
MLTMPRALGAADRRASERGFSILELLIAVTILLLISGAVASGLLSITNSQKTIWNRTEMHSSIRGATELLQQEVGQAGLIALPAAVTLTGAAAIGNQTVGLSSVTGIFQNELLTIDTGNNQETVTVTAVNAAGNTITATFGVAHAAGAPVTVLGGFVSGIVPPQPGFVNGSDATHLKLYGDINGDGNMLYVEYWCDYGSGNLYRNAMPFTAAAKPAVTPAQILLSNVLANPNGTACFTFNPNPLPVVNGTTYVLDVAITLTVQTQQVDPITRQFQTETKALLNVSPRNVFDVWQLASAGFANRLQPMPASVANLLP